MYRRALTVGALALAQLTAPGSAWAQQSDTPTVGISPSPNSPHDHCRPEDGRVDGLQVGGHTSAGPATPSRGAVVTVLGVPGTRGSLTAYTRPGTERYAVGSFTLDADGQAQFSTAPVGNTRYFAQHVYPDCPTALQASHGVVLRVATELGGVNATRLGPRRYGFNGIVGRDGKPGGVDGKVLNLYRATRTREGVIGAPVLTAQTRIAGELWSIVRTFLGSGEFLFWISASDDVNSLGGISPARFTVIH